MAFQTAWRMEVAGTIIHRDPEPGVGVKLENDALKTEPI